MKLSEFNYFLPKNLIAQKPIRPRDHSRLMVLDREKQTIKHDYFYNLGKYLRAGDILVANNSKVIPARLIGRKETRLLHHLANSGGQAGGKAEIFLLRQISDNTWQALVKNCKVGNKIIFSNKKIKLAAEILRKTKKDIWEVKFSAKGGSASGGNLKGKKLIKIINQLGQTPTPPYIKRLSSLKEYQTIYAQYDGSVAAPTAGFHFTKRLINQLKKQGFQFKFITLHVGLGTFQPVRTRNIKKHQMHNEWAELKPGVAKRLNQAKKEGQRIIAVGTTSARTLETFVKQKKLKAGVKWTDLFIYPGYQFEFVDGLITNFHLPKSTLLMLVSAFANPLRQPATPMRQHGECVSVARATADKSAFACPERLVSNEVEGDQGAGQDFIFRAYQEAINRHYRFYSFGDAMLII